MKAVLAALGKSDLDLAIEHMIELAGGPEELLSPSDTKALGSQRVLKKVAELLGKLTTELKTDGLIELGLDYLSRLDTSVVPQVCEFYPSVKDDAVRRVFRRYLSEQAPYEAEAIARLTEHSDRGIVREAVGILFMGGENSNAWRLLHRFAKDMGNLQRASLAQQVVSRIAKQKTVLRLFHAVEKDDSLKVRVGAARTLSKTEGGKAMFVPIAALVMDHSFALREEKEIEAILKALLQLGGKRAVSLLVDLANSEPRLVVGAKRHAHLMQAAQRWLDTARALRD